MTGITRTFLFRSSSPVFGVSYLPHQSVVKAYAHEQYYVAQEEQYGLGESLPEAVEEAARDNVWGLTAVDPNNNY